MIVFMGVGDYYTFIPLWVLGLGLYPQAWRLCLWNIANRLYLKIQSRNTNYTSLITKQNNYDSNYYHCGIRADEHHPSIVRDCSSKSITNMWLLRIENQSQKNNQKMVIDLQWTGLHWVAVLPESRLTDQNVERLKSRIRSHGYYPGQLRY